MKKFILNRFREKSTYIGLFMILSAFCGLDLTEAQQMAIVYFGMAMMAAPENNLKQVLADARQSKAKVSK